MAKREKIAWLVTLTGIATLIDILVITQGWSFPGYQFLGWILVWAICLLITRSFLLSIASVLVISALEDMLFIVIVSSVKGTPIYPFYCHEWVTEVFGGWAGFLGLNWRGIPSSYVILPVIALILYLINRKLKGEGKK